MSDSELPNIYQLVNAGTSPKFANAFYNGIVTAEKLDAKRGDTFPLLIKEKRLQPGPIALWGQHDLWPIVQQAIKEGRTWYYGDHAYFGRGQFFRITKNRLQVDGSYFDHGPVFEANMKRFRAVQRLVPINIEPVKPPGDFILVCPPSEPLSERSGFTQDEWTATVVRKLKGLTKRPIVIRQKPKVNRTPAPLLEAMRGAWAAVTYTSNVAIECLIAGYPAITTGPNPANVFGNFELAAIKRPYVPSVETRTAWAANLCANQWTLNEIASGDAWRAIK